MHDRARYSLKLFVARLLSRSRLTDEEQQSVLGLPSKVFHVGRGKDVVALGDVVDHVCYVAEGLVARFAQAHQGERGERQFVALHIPGDMPDLYSVVLPAATTGLQAISDATILKVPHSAIRKLTETNPRVAEALWRDCLADASVANEWIVNLGHRDSRSRVAHLFCELACRMRVNPSSDTTVTYALPMTQLELAEATGMTSVHMNRTLKALAEIGTTHQSKKVVIKDWAKLAQVGDFDPAYLHLGEQRLNEGAA